MKLFSSILFILYTTVGLCQPTKDIKEITQILSNEYATDTVKLYHKFYNEYITRDIEDAMLFADMKEVELMDDSLSLKERLPMFEDTVLIEFEGLSINYYESEKQLKKANKKKLKKYCIEKYQRRKKKIPLVIISSPLISDDGNHAIVYCTFACGPLCGSSGIQYLKLVNNKWEIDKYEMRSVS